MKKLFLVVGLSAVAAVAYAQAPHRSQNFLTPGIQAILVTNGIPATNIVSAKSVGTNMIGFVYTNTQNASVVVAAGTSDYQPIFQDASLWSDREGRGWGVDYGNTNLLGVTLPYLPTSANISITMISQSGANAAVTFTFAPVSDAAGTQEATTAGDLFIFSFTPTASATDTVKTNVPLHLMQGCAKLRCVRIVNGDTDATSNVAITKMTLNGFQP